MFSKTDVTTIGQLLTLIDDGISDKMEGTISNNRKVTVYKIKLQDIIRMDIRGLDK